MQIAPHPAFSCVIMKVQNATLSRRDNRLDGLNAIGFPL